MVRDVREILVEMLVENTGRYLLDSGYAFGRNWEDNRKKVGDTVEAWEKTPKIKDLWEEDGKIYFVKNIYHFLKEILYRTEEIEEIEKEFYEFADREENKSKSWYDLLEEFFGEHLDVQYHWFNSYNWTSSLSQIIEFITDNYEYMALMIHGGCDVTRGYTAPRFFVFDEEIFDDNWFAVKCDKCKTKFYTSDGGYEWKADHPNGIDKKVLETDLNADSRYFYTDENGVIRHKGCGGKIEVF